jgi:hypothetical protein
MCFTPTISFTIFAIEWILGFMVLGKRKNSGRFHETYSLAAYLLFFLGFYQFTQGMFCVSGDYAFWGLAGFITYTFLPALGLHFAYTLIGKKDRKLSWIYFIPALFSIIAVLTPNFVSIASCSSYFIVSIHSWSNLMGWIYSAYYFGFILYVAYLFNLESRKGKKDWNVVMTGLIGILAFMIPTFILLILVPALKIGFPSILCEFGLLFGICVFWMMHLMEKQR